MEHPTRNNHQSTLEKGDELRTKYREDKKLKDLLSKRNRSIRAHNIKPVDEKTYKELYEKTIEYASKIIKNLNRLLEDSIHKTGRISITQISQRASSQVTAAAQNIFGTK